MEAANQSDEPSAQPSQQSGAPRVLVADDHKDMLRETCELLGHEFNVVGTARDGMALLAAGLELTPDAVVTDIKMPRIGGIEASRELLIRKAVRAVVLLTVHSDPELIKSALDAGIRGYVLKVNAGEELIPAIYEVLRGGVFISSAVRSRSDFCP